MAFTHRATETAITEPVATTLVIAKPAGLTVGDLMVAVIGKDDDPVISGYPSGWTEAAQYNTALGNDVTSGIYYVVATSTETAASDFTWTGDLEEWSGTCSAFIPGNANPVFEGISDPIRRDGDATPVSEALTTTAGNLVVGGCVAAQADTGGLGVATSGYTIAGTPPTTGTSNGDNGSILVYDLSGAGGSLTIEFNNAESGAESHPWIFEFSDETSGDATVTPAAFTVAGALPQATRSGTATRTPDPIAAAGSTPQATRSADDTAVSAAVAVAGVLPAATRTAAATRQPDPLTVAASVPQATRSTDDTVTPSAFAVNGLSPQATGGATSPATVTPNPTAVAVTLPQVQVSVLAVVWTSGRLTVSSTGGTLTPGTEPRVGI